MNFLTEFVVCFRRKLMFLANARRGLVLGYIVYLAVSGILISGIVSTMVGKPGGRTWSDGLTNGRCKLICRFCTSIKKTTYWRINGSKASFKL